MWIQCHFPLNIQIDSLQVLFVCVYNSLKFKLYSVNRDSHIQITKETYAYLYSIKLTNIGENKSVDT